MGETESSYCEGNGVIFLEAIGEGPPEGVDIIWDIKQGDTGSTPTIKFKVDNPFDSDADIYVRYHQKESEQGAESDQCAAEMNVPGCNPSASEIEAVCMSPSGTSLSFSIVSIYFVTNDVDVGIGGAEVDQCCHEAEATKAVSTPVVEYTYEIRCICPITSRNLRGSVPF
jgi:hypothetical protein